MASPQLLDYSGATDLVEQVERLRVDLARRLDPTRRAEFGQYFTPAPVARLMASMFGTPRSAVRILDAGAGAGSLSAALVERLSRLPTPPRQVTVTAYEVDPLAGPSLATALTCCQAALIQSGIWFAGSLIEEDFIEAGVDMLRGGMFSRERVEFDFAILNPPYRKIHSGSRTRHLLRDIGIETSNLYSAFLAIAVRLLAPGGELVAITPRSFCNGPYFKSFRQEFLREMRLRRLHVFEARDTAFREDDVLQENVILHAVKGGTEACRVVISASGGRNNDPISTREVDCNQVVRPDDPNLFIHIVPDDSGRDVVEKMGAFQCGLAELGLAVSTGRVVDFRVAGCLRDHPGKGTVPLIYPAHFTRGVVEWPKQGRKPNAIFITASTEEQLVPAGMYVLVKRFSAKEERRRVTAAIYDPARVQDGAVGFENHLNYYHQNGGGLTPLVAKGLALFLNSTLVDSYFRQFNGHTQVNAADLRSLRYPTREELTLLGRRVGDEFPDQHTIDYILEEELSFMQEARGRDPLQARQKIEQAITILRDLGLPRAQQNERSALTLLALLDIRPDTAWGAAQSPLRGITPMMEFFSKYYGKTYAPNTRETVRRQTVHQFLQAGIIIANPDDPQRATNSPKAVYQIEATTLDLLRTFGTAKWERSLRVFVSSIQTLQERTAQYRVMQRIPVMLADGTAFTLSPGGQNVLIAPIIQEFCERFTPGGMLLYVGDTSDKFAHYDQATLATLGIKIEGHGKMPDVVVYHKEKGWIVLIEAVTSHGPVDLRRRDDLRTIFQHSTAPLVFVTAFLTRRAMVEYLGDIAWETEVWLAEAPEHMIHFNGERFLGPY